MKKERAYDEVLDIYSPFLAYAMYAVDGCGNTFEYSVDTLMSLHNTLILGGRIPPAVHLSRNISSERL